MTRSTLIEVGGEAVGIVVPDGGGYRFVAVKFPVWDLDDRPFPSAEAAQRAARELLESGRGGMPQRHRPGMRAA